MCYSVTDAYSTTELHTHGLVTTGITSDNAINDNPLPVTNCNHIILAGIREPQIRNVFRSQLGKLIFSVSQPRPTSSLRRICHHCSSLLITITGVEMHPVVVNCIYCASTKFHTLM